MYNVFGSGASSHGIHAQFIAQSVAANNGRIVNLLRGVGNMFDSWFYAMYRLLRPKTALYATQPQFVALSWHEQCRLAVQNTENPTFWNWKALYVLLRGVFPHLRFLCFGDSNIPVMDKSYFLCHRATESLQKSLQEKDDDTLFLEFGDNE